MEDVVAEIVAEMDYLRTREQKLRDTNESTNTRVKWFAFSTMGLLVALGAWQVIYLRAYFRHVPNLQTTAMDGLLICYIDRSILFKSFDENKALPAPGTSLYGNSRVLLATTIKRYILTLR